jgi:4-hydroxy-3-methylbut-2-enyl diphosphate reductase
MDMTSDRNRAVLALGLATAAGMASATVQPRGGSGLAFAPSGALLGKSGLGLRQGLSSRPSVAPGQVLMSSAPIDKRAERRRIISNPNFNRNFLGKDSKESVEGMMVEEFTSDLVKELMEKEYVIERDNVTIKLAKSYGFCWGVERAVAMAYEARTFYKDEKIHITNEIIHNPGVNQRLKDMNINFINPDKETGIKDFNVVEEGDVVVLPAFGASLEEMQTLDAKGVKIVDTTCPWVSKVWNAVDTHKKKDMTSIIHGKYGHEESIATASFAETYIIVKDMAEAEYVSNYIINGGSKEEFMKKFANAVSQGFDPEKDLKKVGIANQTTMFKDETAAIAKLFERTMLKKFGPETLNENFLALDTICDATQERQDAIIELIEDKSIDFMLVVGGWDSSNTGHLLEICHLNNVHGYHVDMADRINADGSIEHRTVDGNIEVKKDFLPKGKLTIGVTSGASTPDAYMQDAIERILMLKALEKE